MRMIGAVVLYLGATNAAHAGFTSIQTEKMRSFLDKTKACRVAFAAVDGPSLVNPIYCVWDGIANTGTIHESRGCFVGRFDSEISDPNHRYSPLLNSGAGLQGRSQPDGPCTKDLILKMLTVYPMSDYLSVGRSQEPILASFKKQDKKFRIIWDPEEIISDSKMNEMERWKPSTLRDKTTYRVTIPSPEKNPTCSTFTVTQEDKLKCSSESDLLKAYCEARKPITMTKAEAEERFVNLEAIKRNQLEEANEIVKVYRGRFGKEPDSKCPSPSSQKDDN